MAFVVQCPFCKARARVPDRANGAIGRCPKCASSFTLAPADDQHLPESTPPAGAADESEIEPIAASAVSVAIAVAAAAVEEAKPADSLTADEPQRSAPSGFQPAAAAGALALLLAGFALVCASISFLRGFVLPLSGLGLLTGLTAIVLARLSARPRLLLPILGSAAAGTMLIVAWLFPALLGPAYQHARQRREPAPVGLHAIPLAGAPALADVPEWVDAKRYALQRDGLRVQVVRVSLLHQATTDAKPAQELLLVRARISLERGAKPLERKDQPSPTLTDDLGKPSTLRQSEFFDMGDGKAKSALFPVPTIEETFAFDAPAEGWKTLRLELPASRWRGNGAFQFMIAVPSETAPQQKNK
jgi:hypothetical protein